MEELRTLNERVARMIFMDLAKGLEYIHETANAAHHAIRLESLLYASHTGSTDPKDRAQISNLKYVTESSSAKDNSKATFKPNHDYVRQYLAPELLKKDIQDNLDYRKADVWAFGVCLFAFLFKKLPFQINEKGLGN